MPSYRKAGAALALLAVLFTGCKSGDKPAQSRTKATRLFAIAVDSAAFFRRGPRQGRAPDLKLPKDTVVKVIRPSLGYSKIQVMASGLQGYVASEEIKPASSTLLAAATAPPVDSVDTQTDDAAGGRFNINSNDPRLVPPPEDLPDPDMPAPGPER
jgi:hypothetical protein